MAASRSSIFLRGPEFTLDTFSNREFIVKEFIESLSNSAIPLLQRAHSNLGQPGAVNQSSQQQQQPFDPKPLIRTFEYAKNRLNELSEELEMREDDLSAAVRRAETQHAQNIKSLGYKLNQAVQSFQKLDTSFHAPNSISSSEQTVRLRNAIVGGNVAVETGKELEELDRQRQRALDAQFLIECWDEVSHRGELTLLENLRRQESGAAKVRCANIAKQLLRISRRLDPFSWESNRKSDNATRGGHISALEGMSTGINTREIIEKFSETLEKDLLKQFDEFYRRANFEGMRDCASVLYDFNAGASVIGLFLNQHQFFIDRSQLLNEEVGGDAETWERLADPDSDNSAIEPSLQSLIDEVKVVLQEESVIIKRAFPYYELVLERFLQRVFQQSIQQRLEMVLEKAVTVSPLAFLRSLQASWSYIGALIDDLKAHGLTEHPDPISPQTAVVLDQQFEDLFVPYLTGSTHFEGEKKCIEELYNAIMFKFVTYHARRKKSSGGFMSTLANLSSNELLSPTKDNFLSRLESTDYTPTQRAVLYRIAGVGSDSEGANSINITNEDGLLNIGHAKKMLKWLAEALSRVLELDSSNDTPRIISAFLNHLISTMSEGYIETALDAAYDAATSQESIKVEPDFMFLSYLPPATNITFLMMVCINTVLIPLASSSITTRRDMDKKVKATITRIEEKINAVEQKTIDVVLSWVTRLLSGQRKNDFRPKEDLDGAANSYLETLQTPVSTISYGCR